MLYNCISKTHGMEELRMSVFESVSLMINFGMFVLTLLAVVISIFTFKQKREENRVQKRK
ncbi:putative holin-like toxin [Paenibacillus polymyxa]|uniref:putative holin-like toxin n=1 Tax=Paenibacillus polymyxa TaxID=1406 RepID=UPI003A5CC5C1